VRSLPGWVQADGVVVAPADIQTDEHAVSAGHARCLSSVAVVAGRASMAGTDLPRGRPCPYSAILRCHQSRWHHHRDHAVDWGVSHAGHGDHSALITNHEEGNREAYRRRW